MFFRKKRIKQDIPHDLRLELREIQKKKKEEENTIRYSLSPSQETIDTAVAEIKSVKLKPSFKDTVFKYIDAKNMTDPEVYKKAKVNKRTFSKIRTGDVKYVSKNTVICLGLALELSLEEFKDLLASNSDYLYESSYFDVAIIWCIKNNIYDIEQVNDILYACDLSLLTK